MAKKEQVPASTGPDEHEGHGGSYVVVNGVRQLVERTDLNKDNAPAAAEGQVNQATEA